MNGVDAEAGIIDSSAYLALHLTTSERCRCNSMSKRFSVVLRAITVHFALNVGFTYTKAHFTHGHDIFLVEHKV